MFIRSKIVKGKTYLQLVESRWVDGRCQQVVLRGLGRLEALQKSGELDSLLRSGMKFSRQLAVLDAHKKGESISTRSERIGAGLIFEKLWKEIQMPQVLDGLLNERKHEFSLERAIFITVLHRLCSPGSDRACEKWMEDQKIAGKDTINLHHFYRTMGWLGEALEPTEQSEGKSARCMKDKIEEELFARHRDLFTGLDLVFFDTTSIYFEGEGGESLGAYGHSKDSRGDLKQMVVGVVLDNRGDPVCSEYWPGNTTDVKSLIPVAERLKKEFGIKQVCVVADRGMISEDNKRQIKEMGWNYILGVRMRRESLCRDIALARGGRYKEVYRLSEDSKDPSPLKVKEVLVEGVRYVICLNEKQAEKDKRDREAIVEGLRKNLSQGEKTLIGNKGYRKYVKKTKEEVFSIDEEKIKEEERYDGKWVLTTDTNLSSMNLALKYKQLWMVEDIFRSMKSVLETRPIYHKCDDTIRGHVFCSFLALILRKRLQDAWQAKGWTLEWADVMRDLNELMQIQIKVSGKEYILRTETKGTTGKIFQAVGVALPPQLIQKA